MSTPLSEREYSERVGDQPQDEPSDDGPSEYAPKRPRMPKADPASELAGALAGVNAAATSDTTDAAEPPWRRKNQPGAFVGDLDIVELRHRLGRSDRIPEPPLPEPSGSRLTTAWRVTIIVGTAAGIAAGVIGYRWSTLPGASTQPPPASSRAEIVDVAALASLPPVDAPQPPVRPDQRVAALYATTGLASPPAPPALTPTSPPPTAALPAPSAPSGGQGASAPTSAPAPAPQQLDAAEIAVMIKRGAEYMTNGNIGAARVMLRAAAEAGDAQAAFALAETYDPFVLARLGAKGGVTSDVAQARRWYEAARSLGSTVAADRLVRLAGRSD